MLRSRVLLKPIVYSLLRVVQIGLWFPTILGVQVSLSLDQVHLALPCASAYNLGVDDRFDAVFLLVTNELCGQRSRQLLVIERGWMIRGEKGLVEYVVDFPGVWNLQTVSRSVYLL